ncbi:hypothetical protein PTSG_00909 [Salpingoeca rosetta]|uniref:Uncharacterized protein n=1 Tax=Salpingoeca rosetta (strain ATCC 50818 / BSB-021) TaxID=946362 RepID=F2TXU5_SALR5|nr:uncharacterized protein PTSG_00909 [Salpingoeca rosetta]EGD76204.1 hypothetical protein PTSG_00909 [Salpingoeca rosetta]|eukprot:XP_004998379.1 hypothetical protein PTSG_00909 [Salpingoeca rosetta]
MTATPASTVAAAAHKSSSSLLFQPYRAVGYIASHVPFALQARGGEHFVTTVVGHAYHVYNCKRLNLVFVGHIGSDVSAVACAGRLTFAATGNIIIAKKRDVNVRTYREHAAPVHILLPFGTHLISVDTANVINVFDVASEELFCTIDELPAATFKVSCVFHPSTYLNKILLGSKQGALQLWNIRTRTLVHTFKGWGSGVSCVAQSPVVDVVGIGLESGAIHVHNLRYDESVVSFTQDGGPITAVSFRTDGEPIMASANTSGSVAIWDLESRRLVTVLLAHTKAVASMQFLQSQPLLLTSSADNSLKLWVFDAADGGARILRSREGHSAPPTKIRYHGSSGHDMLSAARDRTLRYTCVIQDERSCELSQGSLQSKANKQQRSVGSLRLPPIVDFDSESTREGDWDTIATCHKNKLWVRTWSFENKVIGKHELKGQGLSKLTPCGQLFRYNMQSGALGAEYGAPAHADTIVGIHVDSVNSFVASASKDTTLKVWSFGGVQRLNVKMKVPLTTTSMCRINNLIAAAGVDFGIRVFDVDAKRAVRGFGGHQGRITDMAWTPDGRWLISASMDLTVRVWDVPSGRMLSWFSTEKAVTSMTMSPNGDFLATTHIDQLGIFLWANRSMFGDVAYKILDSKEIAEGAAPFVSLPVSGRLTDEEKKQAVDYLKAFEVSEDDAVLDESESTFKSPDQISKDLVTLSSLAASRWQNLSKLEHIRQRNKPKEGPKAPPRAPFFLQTKPGLKHEFKPMFDPLAETGAKSKVLNFSEFGVLSAFQRTLLQCNEEDNFDALIELISTMGITAIETEIRSLSADNVGGDSDDPVQFLAMLNFFRFLLTARKNFELCQAYLHLFLTVHTADIARFPQLEPVVAEVQRLHRSTWTELDGMFQHALCMITYFKNPRL